MSCEDFTYKISYVVKGIANTLFANLSLYADDGLSDLVILRRAQIRRWQETACPEPVEFCIGGMHGKPEFAGILGDCHEITEAFRYFRGIPLASFAKGGTLILSL